VKPAFGGRAVISGIGKSAVGRRLGRSAIDLTLEASLQAIADAGLKPSDIDGLATWPGGRGPTGGSETQEVQDALRLQLNWYLGGGETAGQMASVISAATAVACGLADHVLVYRTVVEATRQGGGGRQGIENLKHIPGNNFLLPWMIPFGSVSVPNWVATYATRHFHDYGTTREHLYAIASTFRRHAALNPVAYFREPLSHEQYFGSRMISTPLCLFDCDVPVDMSTAVVVSRVEHAGDLEHPAVHFNAVGAALCERQSYDQFATVHQANRDAAERMWSQTDLKPADVDVVQLYDGFTILALIELEAFGFCGLGEGGPFVADGSRIALGGELPVNTDGGQLSAGRSHGFGILHEACVQLRGEGGERQVAGAEVCLIGGGSGPTSSTLLLTPGS
jgi:acetyl-CoA acetyltransferase